MLAAIIVTLFTAWYALLTYLIMRATAKQASAALQPVLALSQLAESREDAFHTILIENKSDRPVVFLDVAVSCHPWGHERLIQNFRALDDQILSGGDRMELPLDFSKELAAIRVDKLMCGFGADLVVSDLSRQVAIQYEFSWVIGRFACKVGQPWRVRWRYFVRPWVWRYHRLMQWRLRKTDSI